MRKLAFYKKYIMAMEEKLESLKPLI